VLERFGRRAPVHLLATGPLTDVALALEAAPELGGFVDRLVAMGGAFGSPGGNVSPRAEFNFFTDPGAAAAVCRAPCRLELVPLDVTEQVVLGADALAFLEARLGPSSLACRMARAGIELHRRDKGAAHLPLHDPLAVAVLVEPGLVGGVESGLSVCVEGPARGHVELVDHPPVHRVALSVDAARVEAAILDALVRD
jgi:purine nucleosidase